MKLSYNLLAVKKLRQNIYFSFTDSLESRYAFMIFKIKFFLMYIIAALIFMAWNTNIHMWTFVYADIICDH